MCCAELLPFDEFLECCAVEQIIFHLSSDFSSIMVSDDLKFYGLFFSNLPKNGILVFVYKTNLLFNIF